MITGLFLASCTPAVFLTKLYLRNLENKGKSILPIYTGIKTSKPA
jgi:hypothetical protein